MRRVALYLRLRFQRFLRSGSRALLLLNEAHPKWRRRRRIVEGALAVEPSTSDRVARADQLPDTVWGVAMVRNEAEILPFTVAHLFEQGVDQLLVADNLSSDSTLDVLHELAREYPIVVAHDKLEAYYQGDKITVLGRIARERGAGWVIPFDADELFFAERTNVASYLRTTRCTKVFAQIWNYFPATDDDPDEQNPFVRIRRREPFPMPFYRKVSYRVHRFARVDMGYHDVRRPGRTGDGLHVAHFPYRSESQFVDKFRYGGPAIGETDLVEAVARHWRVGGELDSQTLRAAFLKLLSGEKLSFDPYRSGEAELIVDPVWGRDTWAPFPRGS